MDEHVFKLVRDIECNDSFRISVEFKEDTFNLTVLQKLNAWIATVDKKNIVCQAEQLEINVDKYYRKLQDYFTKTLESADLKFNNNELAINCKLENNMKIKYFSCILKPADYSICVENLLDRFYTERNSSIEKLKVLNTEKCELEKSKNYLQSKLNEFIERKKIDDQELYNSFVISLNEKKKRIQHLHELLEAFKRGRPTLNPFVEVRKKTKKSKIPPKTEIKDEISSSESDHYSTDEEKTKNPQDLSDEDTQDDTNKDKKIAESMPSTSKCDFDLFGDDSPPRHLLPKRIKSEISADTNNVNKPSTSTQSSEKNKCETTTVRAGATDDTPNVNFSTQDLLDNM